MIIVAPSHTRAQSAHYTRAPSYNIIVIGRRVRCGPEREAPEQALITTTACYDNNNNNSYNDNNNNIACTYGYCSVYDRLRFGAPKTFAFANDVIINTFSVRDVVAAKIFRTVAVRSQRPTRRVRGVTFRPSRSIPGPRSSGI